MDTAPERSGKRDVGKINCCAVPMNKDLSLILRHRAYDRILVLQMGTDFEATSF